MSETNTQHGHEQHHPNHEAEQQSREKLDELIEKAHEAKHEHKEQIDEIRQETRAEAIPAAQLLEQQQQTESDNNRDNGPALVNHELKDIKYQRTLQSVQKNLSAPEKALSKVVHNPLVDAVSEVAGKTIARPSGLLAGGICAFIGSSTFLWIAKHYGYTYNFMIMTLFFIGGFFIGLLVEFGMRLSKKS